MSPAVAAVLNDTPEATDLRCQQVEGRTVVTVGSVALFFYDRTDLASRNIAMTTLRSLGFSGRRVAAAFGLGEQHVATVHNQALREGPAGVVRRSGRPPKLSQQQVAQAVAWHRDGLSNVEIGRRLGVHNATVSRALSPAPEPTGRDDEAERKKLDPTVTPDVAASGVATRDAATSDVATTDVATTDVEPSDVEVGGGVAGSGAEAPAMPVAGQTAATGMALRRIGVGTFFSRYAGAMLLHAFTDRVGATNVFASAATSVPGLRFDDVAVLSSVSTVFALGFASLEQAKHPDRAQVGPLAGIEVLPQLRTLRPRLAAIADGCDPLGLQRAFATAMLTADPCTSGVYYVDEHFVPYTAKLPVGKGWNTKRRRAEAGRVDTMVCDSRGRAVCFTNGEPSGLSVSLPATLAELRAITGEDAKIMLGFDRGGAYASVFTVCREENADWITYRRGELATPTRLPVTATLTRGDDTVTVVYTDETVTIKDYGQCRQITLFEHGTPVLQILTSDTTACPGALIWFMRARWRIENLFKYLDFYGIDSITDYTATIDTNTRPVPNPARIAARAQLKRLHTERDELRERIGAAHTDRTLSITALNRASTTAQRKIHTLEKEITAAQDALKTIPAKLPANLIDPDAKRAIHRTTRRALHMVLRLLAHNAEHWLAHQLNAYLQDPHEYRATTRNLLHLGGTITYTPQTIHVELDQPATPRLTRALALLLDEINTTPPHIPGDPRPITYTINKP
jgi:transposase